jgi:hypothetical protein
MMHPFHDRRRNATRLGRPRRGAVGTVRTVLAAVILVTLNACSVPSAGVAPSSSSAAQGPATHVLYRSPATAPDPSALYARAVQLDRPGKHRGDLLATFEQYTAGRPVFPSYRSTDGGEH